MVVLTKEADDCAILIPSLVLEQANRRDLRPLLLVSVDRVLDYQPVKGTRMFSAVSPLRYFGFNH